VVTKSAGMLLLLLRRSSSKFRTLDFSVISYCRGHSNQKQRSIQIMPMVTMGMKQAGLLIHRQCCRCNTCRLHRLLPLICARRVWQAKTDRAVMDSMSGFSTNYMSL
jgi:hypothetical protein